MPPRDDKTLSLLDWTPPEVAVARYAEPEIRSASLRDRISRAVALTLRESDVSREELADRMGTFLGEEVRVASLNAYASQARDDHTISYLRLLALIHATGDTRLLQLGAELFAMTVIDDTFLPWVEVGQLAVTKEEIGKALDAALRTARRGGGR